MKQRVTYLQPEGTGIDPNIVHVNPDSLVFTNSKNAALEKRVTAGLSELPTEITDILKDVHELHIRWSSPRQDNLPSPVVSKVPSGLHVFYTPRHADKEVELCSLIKNLFGTRLHCHSVSESFSRPPILSERFSSSSSYQYYHVLHDLKAFQKFIERTICPPNLKLGLACGNEADAIQRASHVDIDFDVISHAVTATVVWKADADWKEPLDHPNTARVIVKLREQDRLEIGVLQGEKADEPEEISLGGYLSVLGEDDKPNPTVFSFPSRHHSPPASQPGQHFQASFQQPTGLHPKLDLTFPDAAALTPPNPSCALHAYLTLPTPIFIDRYQFSDPLFLASQNLLSLRSLSGEQDLEAPTWVLKSWGSAALLELAHPNSTTTASSSPWTVTIPTHLRYLSASINKSSDDDLDMKLTHASFDLPTPIVFWACQAEEGLKFRTNPFDRENLGYDGLFGPKTLFYHIPGAAEEGGGIGETDGMMSLDVPILDPSRAGWVSAATAIVVLLGFGWVGWKLFAARAGSSAKVQGEKKKQ